MNTSIPLVMVGLFSGLATVQAQAATTYSASVTAKAYAYSHQGPPAISEVFDGANGSRPLSFSLGTGGVVVTQDFTTAFGGRCVVIVTGAPCQGDEAPLTTRTIYDSSQPIRNTQTVSASASASAYANSGSVGARSLSAASLGFSHARVDPVDPGKIIPGSLYSTGSSQAQASAGILHTNTVLGPTGSVATITLRGVASSSLFINSGMDLGNTAFLGMEVTGRADSPGQRCRLVTDGCYGRFGVGRQANPNSLTPFTLGFEQQSYAFSFQARPGDLVTLIAYITTGTTNTGEADASHTLTIGEIELSNGFSFADETGLVRTGNTYAFAAAVPEPEHGVMFATGAFLVAVVVRRRRTRMNRTC